MASKSDRFYYENLVSAAECGYHAAQYLEKCLTDYDPANLETMIREMHVFEHDGDMKRHEMHRALAKAFVTPIDREDLAEISHNIDEVTDAIEEVLQRFYLNEIKTVMPEAVAFAAAIVKCCELMREMLSELSSFKKPQKLREKIIAVCDLEEECDQLYIQATIAARKFSDDLFTVFAWREIFDHLEICADACEHVADCVETIVMKNT